MEVFGVLLILMGIVIKCGSQMVLKCAPGEQRFEKVIGYRPEFNFDPDRTIWETSSNSPIINNNYRCLQKCQTDENCPGYIFHLSSGRCFQIPTIIASDPGNLIPDPSVIYYAKTCVNTPAAAGECRTKGWPILRIPGSMLIGAGFKQINRLVSRQECAQLCLHETEFVCRSASYIPSFRNNFDRTQEFQGGNSVDRSAEKHRMGQCILSREDKNSKPDAFRVANDNKEEYLENQCVAQDFIENQCSFERYLNASLIYADDQLVGLSEKECQERCSNETRFKCIGMTYLGKLYTGSLHTTKCSLHSDDTIALGPRALKPAPGSVYMRRVKCLNINVVCDGGEMIVRYVPVQYFVGRLYVNARSEKNCSYQGQGKDQTILHIPIGDEIRENSCGILRAYQISSSAETHNRTLISAVIVIQNHPSVQSQGDRLIKVGCVLNGHENPLSTGDNNERNQTVFLNTEVQVEGGNPYISDLNIKPSIKVIDLDNNVETKRVQVGQNMELRVFYKEPIPYDFQIVDFRARSDNDQEISLLDRYGCPVDQQIFRGLSKTVLDGGNPSLIGRFFAFKFANSSEVKFELIVKNCYRVCQPAKCHSRRRRTPQGPLPPIKFPTTPQPLGYIKFPKPLIDDKINENISEEDYSMDVLYQRVISSFDEPLETKAQKLGDESQVEVRQVSRNFSKVVEIPMRFAIKVDSAPDSIVSESLIYGENNNSIMISGLDGDNGDEGDKKGNTICIDQTFLLCLLLFFALLVIVLVVGCSLMIYRYKKRLQLEEDRSSLHRFHLGFDPYDSFNRRVHWADDGICNPRSAYP